MKSYGEEIKPHPARSKILTMKFRFSMAHTAAERNPHSSDGVPIRFQPRLRSKDSPDFEALYKEMLLPARSFITQPEEVTSIW